MSLQASEQPLVERFDVALLDLDGVIYLGHDPIPTVPQSLAAVRSAGMRLAFVTNNASRTPQQVADLLSGMDVPATPGEVVTAAQAAAHVLADRLPAGAPVLVLGTTGLIEAVADRGLVPVFSADDEPQAVVQGYSPDMGWKQLAEGMVAIRNGAYYLATNLDLTVPSNRGALPGNGALVAALATASGVTPDATGKPDPTMHAETVQRTGARHPLVIGDRLDTDIEGAGRVGCPSLLVFSGVTDAAALLGADPVRRPDFLAADVSGLLRRHPGVSTDGATTTVGIASARVADGTITLSLDHANASTDDPSAVDESFDGLRALAAACWAEHDAGRPVSALSGSDDAASSYLHSHRIDRWKTA